LPSNERSQSLDGLRVNLADAGFGDAKTLRNFAEAEIFKVIERENLSLHLGQLIEPLRDQMRDLICHGGFDRIDLAIIRDALVLRAALIGVGES
jgi:hypothetical protein